jgi:hypothetical protein
MSAKSGGERPAVTKTAMISSSAGGVWSAASRTAGSVKRR